MIERQGTTGDDRARERRAMVQEIEQEMRAMQAWRDAPALPQRVAAALNAVPRHRFVPDQARAEAYENRPLPIGAGQTISQPFIVALMTALLDPQPGHAVLEIGTGSGYQAAILSRLAARVYSVETVPELSRVAAARLREQGCDNVELRTGDGNEGWPEHAPYDGIIVTAAAPAVPPALIEQLRPGGRMVIPAGPQYGPQELLLLEKDEQGRVERRDILAVAFVPLVGKPPEGPAPSGTNPGRPRMSPLAENRCEACRAGAPQATKEEMARYLREIADWRIVEREGVKQLERTYAFKNFVTALEFTNRVGAIAEEEGHHPDLLTSWGEVTVTWWSHKIKGLHRNDFIMAAKTDRLYAAAGGAVSP